jgi:fumarylpyruvate hydrolase
MPFPALTWKAHVLSGCAPGPTGPVKRLSGSPSIFQPQQHHEQRQTLRHFATPAGGACDRRIERAFPGPRIWCVGRNYLEHIKEMGQDAREPPFFFAKPADAIVPDGGTAPYPPLTKDMHHEVELVVALKSGGRNIPTEKALDCVYGYGVGIDLTRRDLQIASRDIKRPWEIGKAFDASAPCGPLMPVSRIGHPSKGRIVLKCNGKVRQDGDLQQMIWNVPEIISKLSEMVALEAGDIIMTGTPSGVAATVAGDKLECEVDGVGKLTVTIGPPLN